jgi:hypothetical protein
MLLVTSSSSGTRALAPQRRTVVSVCNVFSLRRSLSSIVKHNSAPRPDGHLHASALAMEAPASSIKLSPRKSIQGVPVNQRETVELIMALTSLDSKPTSALVSTVLPHPLLAAPAQQADKTGQLGMPAKYLQGFWGLLCDSIFNRTALTDVMVSSAGCSSNCSSNQSVTC